MAPNLITFIGFLLMLSCIPVLYWTDPRLTQMESSWTFIYYAAALWIYATLDNIDGKQARRTNSSSPLGELFDHGCDSLNASIAAILQASAMGIGQHPKLYWLALALTLWGFYLPTWEEYHTGVLHLGFVNGPTEGIVVACLVLLVAGIWGPSVWHQILIWDRPILYYALRFYLIGFVLTIVSTSLWTVYKARRSRKLSFLPTLRQFTPPMIGTLFIALWVSTSKYLQTHPMPFSFAVGIVFAKTATKVILAHLTKQSFPSYTRLLTPLILGSLISALGLFTPRLESLYAWFYLGFVLVAYSVWARHIVDAFCCYLGIRCFRLGSYHPTLVHID